MWTLKRLHEKNWRESLHVLEFLIIHQIFSEFLQPFRDLRIQPVALFPLGFLLVFVFLLAWLSSGCPDRSSTEVDTCSGEIPLLLPSSCSRIWVSLTVGEEDELEEGGEQWFSCLEGVLEVDEDPEDELDKPGTTIGTKFSVLQGIRIPFFNEMCVFWPLIYS